ncbi:MAG: Txe/YoeB family addiction module toxin [Alphaproteobacteria bacterium]|nr:Txe/YoeB family addiction module toxin [Alphaproteobacteria bacterium]
MNLEFDDNAFEDLRYWIEIDLKKAKKIMALIEEVKRSPFKGTGKPEPLKHKLERSWSRRIDQEHRLVYTVEDKKIRILSCRYHY